ncbi:MAG: hypothetical protein LBE13_22745 [Bacteroidales bacterium]|nr:hypothetical protein [Bacteroidales bacterium]
MKKRDLRIAQNMAERLKGKLSRDICPDDCGGCPFDSNECPKTLAAYIINTIEEIVVAQKKAWTRSVL